jgi:hypothetical protein
MSAGALLQDSRELGADQSSNQYSWYGTRVPVRDDKT